MSDGDLDFDADELAMLRQLFRSEAHDALEVVTSRVLSSGTASRPMFACIAGSPLGVKNG